MPLPHYIIGSMLRSDDKTTGLVSYFQVVEKLTIAAFGPLPEGMPEEFKKDASPTILISVSWMRDEGEEQGAEFDSEWLVKFPTKPDEELLHSHTFQITESFARIGLNLGIVPKNSGSGHAYVENRVRPHDSDKAWQSQRFNFVMEITAVQPNDGEPEKDK